MRKHRILEVRNTTFSLLIITCTLLILTNNLFAQSTSSPYSRYGIGEINNKNFGQTAALGGTNIAMQNDTLPLFFINPNNPASYSNMRLTTAEVGMNYNRVQLQNTDSKQKINNASLGYVALAFPLKKWWGMSFGLVPFSEVGYKVTDHQVINSVPIDYLYDGSGGVNQLYIGNGLKPLYGLQKMFIGSDYFKRLSSKTNPDNTLKTDSAYKADQATIKTILKHKKSLQNLSLGFNFSYLFGHIDHSRRDLFPYSGSFFNTRTGITTRVSDVYFDYGVQYAFTIDSVRYRDDKDSIHPIKRRALKDKVQLLFGATFAAQTNIRAKNDSLVYTYYSDAQGYERVKDTIENTKGTHGNITLPLSFGVGLGLKKGDKWLIAADFAMQNWSSYKAFDQSGGLKNSMRVSLGGQWTPNSGATQKHYMQRVRYRAGVRYAQTALELKSTQLTESAVSIGFGFPIGTDYRSYNFSMLNVGLEFGERGTINNGLIKENFFKATIGFTINDLWFRKYKYD
jgi:hypothetical protein